MARMNEIAYLKMMKHKFSTKKSIKAKSPLDINAFMELMSYHIIELDPEDVQLEAWSKWDPQGSGQLDEQTSVFCFS